MKTIQDKKYLTIGEVAHEIGRIPQTLKNWLKWYDEQSDDIKQKFPLPQPITDLDTKGTRYFLDADVETFRTFRDKVKYGTMADFSVTRWGKRGQEIQQRKDDVD